MKSILLALFTSAALATSAAVPLAIPVALKAPDAAWRVTIHEVREVGSEYWVLAHLERSPRAMGIQVITTVRDEVSLQATPKPVKTFITGKTWKWKNDEDVSFIEGRDKMPAEFEKGRVVYERVEKNKKP